MGPSTDGMHGDRVGGFCEQRRIFLETICRDFSGEVSNLPVHRYSPHQERTREKNRPDGNRRRVLGGGRGWSASNRCLGRSRLYPHLTWTA